MQGYKIVRGGDLSGYFVVPFSDRSRRLTTSREYEKNRQPEALSSAATAHPGFSRVTSPLDPLVVGPSIHVLETSGLSEPSPPLRRAPRERRAGSALKYRYEASSSMRRAWLGCAGFQSSRMTPASRSTTPNVKLAGIKSSVADQAA